ncbi:MAG: DUF934 domain-containing protein [Oleiphilaceae bacterium]|nr:DUF934 domain-containing protein [Oleiphilaceae bacterium]
MPKLIKNGDVLDNNWVVLDRDHAGEIPSGDALVPLDAFLANADELSARDNLGVWLDSDQGPEPLAPYLENIAVVAINFPKFVDGRGYSYARILRERFGFKGEIRAIGDVLHDQLFYLKRCGFDAFAIRDDKDAQAAIAGLQDFSECYQAGCDQPTPLFRRRA